MPIFPGGGSSSGGTAGATSHVQLTGKNDEAGYQHITAEERAAIQNTATTPTSTNPVTTQADLTPLEDAIDVLEATAPTVNQKAAMEAASSPGADNPFATVQQLPADELTADELAAIQNGENPSADNPFATVSQIPDTPDLTNMPTVNQKAAMDAASSPSADNPFATQADLGTSGDSNLTADELAAIQNGENPSSTNPFATVSQIPEVPSPPDLTNLPTTAQKAAMEAASSPSAANPFATQGEIPDAPDLTNMPTVNQKAAMEAADTPSSSNPFATVSQIPDAPDLTNMPTTAQKAAMTAANTPSVSNPFATMSDLGTSGDSNLTADELAAIQGAATPSSTNVFATMSDLGTSGGTGLNFLGSVATVAALPTSASAGDAYFVDNQLYVWDSTQWVNVGFVANITNPITTASEYVIKEYSDIIVCDQARWMGISQELHNKIMASALDARVYMLKDLPNGATGNWSVDFEIAGVYERDDDNGNVNHIGWIFKELTQESSVNYGENLLGYATLPAMFCEDSILVGETPPAPQVNPEIPKTDDTGIMAYGAAIFGVVRQWTDAQILSNTPAKPGKGPVKCPYPCRQTIVTATDDGGNEHHTQFIHQMFVKNVPSGTANINLKLDTSWDIQGICLGHNITPEDCVCRIFAVPQRSKIPGDWNGFSVEGQNLSVVPLYDGIYSTVQSIEKYQQENCAHNDYLLYPVFHMGYMPPDSPYFPYSEAGIVDPHIINMVEMFSAAGTNITLTLPTDVDYYALQLMIFWAPSNPPFSIGGATDQTSAKPYEWFPSDTDITSED